MNKHLSPLSLFAAIAAATLFAATSPAESQWREPSHFEITTNAGVGYSMFVVGSHPDLGDWAPLRAVPLAWHEGNVWSADIGLRAGAKLPSTENTGYKFVKRPTDAADYPDANKTEWMDGANLATNVPADADAPYDGKRVVFRCPWDPPVQIVWTTLSAPSYDAETEWHATDLVQTSSGRYESKPGEIGEPGEWMRFTFSGYENGEKQWYHFYGTTNEDFFSPLDAFCVDAGQVFDYEPSGDISSPRIVDIDVGSSYPTITGRTIRVYLPRGYDQNTSRRYPVLYFADGQNIFSDQHSSSIAWGVDIAANREIRGGRMREAILVGVPCRTELIPGTSEKERDYARLWEYLPGTDYLMGSPQLLGRELWGLGTDYANFLIHNVRPTIDYNVCKDRTLNDRANTGHVGSSAGGLLSFFLGTYTNVFGLVGAVSGVYNQEYIPNFRNWCTANPGAIGTNAIKRIWLDTGTEETDVEGLNLYESNWDALTLLLYAGHVQNKTLHFGVYTGDYGQHNEYAWAARASDILRFLLPVTDEFNPLLPRELGLNGDTITFPIYPASSDSIVHLSALLPPITTNTIPIDDTTDHPWSVGTFAPTNAGFYFLKSTP